MIISVASGKGGTGKTTVAASLASINKESVFIDCDVEEPNGHLLLQPEFEKIEVVNKLLPKINYDLCGFCGRCVEFCEFNALINLKSEILLVKEMCHSCGVCYHFCPRGAITEIPQSIGEVRSGKTKDGIEFYDAILRIGESSAAPLINKVKKNINYKKLNIIDSPPGTSCSMVETVRETDYCVLVTESSPFGFNDLKLAIDVLNTINIPFGVVINKYEESYSAIEDYLADQKITLLNKIPFSRKSAEDYSNGILPYKNNDKLISIFNDIIEKIKFNVNNEQEKIKYSCCS